MFCTRWGLSLKCDNPFFIYKWGLEFHILHQGGLYYRCSPPYSWGILVTTARSFYQTPFLKFSSRWARIDSNLQRLPLSMEGVRKNTKLSWASLSPSFGWQQAERAQGQSGLLPAKRIFTRSSGCSAKLDRTPPLTPATRFSYRTWRNTALHADGPEADWPWPVIDSGPADTSAPRVEAVGREAVATTVAATNTPKQNCGTLAHFRDRRKDSERRPTARSRQTLQQARHDKGQPQVTPAENAREVGRTPPLSLRPASPTAAEGWGWRAWKRAHRTASGQPWFPKLRSAAGSSLGGLFPVSWKSRGRK